MNYSDEGEYIIVDTPEALLSAIDNNEEYILIDESYEKEFREDTEMPLSENELAGFQVGSGGGSALGGELIYQLMSLFSNEPKLQQKIDKKIRKYTIKRTKENNLLLYLRMLDY